MYRNEVTVSVNVLRVVKGRLSVTQMKKLPLVLVSSGAQIFMNASTKCTLPCFQDIINSSFILLLAYCLSSPQGIRQRRRVNIPYCRSVRFRNVEWELYWKFNFSGKISVNWKNVAKLIYSLLAVAVDGSVSGCLAPRSVHVTRTPSLYLTLIARPSSLQIYEDKSNRLRENLIYKR